MPDGVGRIVDHGASVPYRHADVWLREPCGDADRLRVGGGLRPVDRLLTLSTRLVGDLFVVVELRVPRCGDPVKLESEALDLARLVALVDEHRDLFDEDGRANLWIGATDSSGLLVLDEHDVIFAYGPLDTWEDDLRAAGCVPGEPVVPFPHEHHYRERFDGVELALRARDWNRELPVDDAD